MATWNVNFPAKSKALENVTKTDKGIYVPFFWYLKVTLLHSTIIALPRTKIYTFSTFHLYAIRICYAFRGSYLASSYCGINIYKAFCLYYSVVHNEHSTKRSIYRSTSGVKLHSIFLISKTSGAVTFPAIGRNVRKSIIYPSIWSTDRLFLQTLLWSWSTSSKTPLKRRAASTYWIWDRTGNKTDRKWGQLTWTGSKRSFTSMTMLNAASRLNRPYQTGVGIDN